MIAHRSKIITDNDLNSLDNLIIGMVNECYSTTVTDIDQTDVDIPKFICLFAYSVSVDFLVI